MLNFTLYLNLCKSSLFTVQQTTCIFSSNVPSYTKWYTKVTWSWSAEMEHSLVCKWRVCHHWNCEALHENLLRPNLLQHGKHSINNFAKTTFFVVAIIFNRISNEEEKKFKLFSCLCILLSAVWTCISRPILYKSHLSLISALVNQKSYCQNSLIEESITRFSVLLELMKNNGVLKKIIN